MTNVKRKKKLPKVPLIIGTVMLLSIGGAWYWRANQINDEPTSTKQFSGPTEQEKADSESHKDELVKQMNDEKKDEENQTSANPNSKKTVVVTLINAAQSGEEVRVSGFVSGIFEAGGTCTAAFTKGSLKLTKTSKGFTNVSTTDCEPITLTRSEFQEAGSWEVNLQYSSAAAEGVSQARTLTIK